MSAQTDKATVPGSPGEPAESMVPTVPGQASGTGGRPGSMRRSTAWPLVAMREIHVRLTDRNFQVSTAFTLVLLLASLVVPALIGGDSPHYRVAVNDQAATTLLAQAEEQLSSTDEDPETRVEAVTVTDRAAAEQAIGDGDVVAALMSQDGTWQLLSDGEVDPALTGALEESVRTDALARNAEAAGTTVDELTRGTVLDVVTVGPQQDDDRRALVAILGIVFALLFYMSALMFGMSIASSVVEEKQSRIVEILAAAIPVRQLLVGKVLGNTVLAFGQLALIIAVGLIGLTFTDLDILLPGVASAIGWYVPFFVVGFLSLACVWAAAGAMASRTEDLQATTMPLTVALVAVLFVGIGLQGTAREIGSFVPVLSTILMPVRLLEGQTSWWEPVLALALTLVFSMLTVAAGTRLYRRALLQTQGRVSLRTAWSTRD